jgi:hypothetical protein
MSPRVFALSIHADYRCRHSGACCTADWDVPVELSVYRSLDAAVAAGTLRVSTAAAPLHPFIVEPDLPDDAAAMLERTERGDCVFFERGSGLCIVHRDLGERSLPSTCRHFPRVALRDARGTFVTLSHFCPTAASMLFRDDVALRVVESPPAFPLADYEGLVVGDEDLSPLLTPRTLMDLEGYAAWERHMVARCAAPHDPESVLATLSRDVMQLRKWAPGRVTLVQAVARLQSDFVAAPRQQNVAESLTLRADVVAAMPEDLRPVPDESDLDQAFSTHVYPKWKAFDAPLNRYLAAKAFASWTAYQGRGAATVVRGLETALALVRVEATRECRDAGRDLDADLLLEAFRSADFALNHLAVGEDLAEAWSVAEVGR